MARKTKVLTLQDKIKPILEKEHAAYEKAGVVRRFAVTFPNRHKAPLLGRLAVKLLNFSGGIIQIQFDEVSKK